MKQEDIGIALRDLPQSIRPRERLISEGPEALSDYELLAIIIRSGGKKNSALRIAMMMLQSFQTLYQMREASLEELQTFEGVGLTKAVELKAMMELGKRMTYAKQEKKGVILSSDQASQLFIEDIGHYQQENVLVYYLNVKNEIIKKRIIFVGGLASSVAHPREIYREAVKVSAAQIIVGHNNPSGNPEPSQADIEFTKRLSEAGKLLGIELLDHIIVGTEKFLSLRERGIF